jgi:hypothetical protein
MAIERSGALDRRTDSRPLLGDERVEGCYGSRAQTEKMRTRAFSFGRSSWRLVVAAALAAAWSGSAVEDGAEGTTDGLDAREREQGAPRAEDGPATRSTPILELLAPERLTRIRAALPEVEDTTLSAILHSPSTIGWTIIVPGYQDSFGDNVIASIGFRPTTIDPQRGPRRDRRHLQ